MSKSILRRYRFLYLARYLDPKKGQDHCFVAADNKEHALKILNSTIVKEYGVEITGLRLFTWGTGKQKRSDELVIV